MDHSCEDMPSTPTPTPTPALTIPAPTPTPAPPQFQAPTPMPQTPAPSMPAPTPTPVPTSTPVSIAPGISLLDSPTPPAPIMRQQSSLNVFLNLPTYDPPAYFVINWPENAPPTAIFTNTPPQSPSFQSIINWRGTNATITITTTLPNEPSTWRETARKTTYRNVPLLKSHLQKCLRRQRQDLAVRTPKPQNPKN